MINATWIPQIKGHMVGDLAWRSGEACAGGDSEPRPKQLQVRGGRAGLPGKQPWGSVQTLDSLTDFHRFVCVRVAAGHLSDLFCCLIILQLTSLGTVGPHPGPGPLVLRAAMN